MNYFGKELTAFKANLHTHSTTSDGKFEPEKVIQLYADAGYDVLAFTDHKKTNPVSKYNSRGMTLISGMELHPAGPRNIMWHILGLDVPEDFIYPEPASGQEAVDAVTSVGGIAFCAHPYWCGLTSAEVATLKGIEGIEVYNTSTRYIGKEYNMQCWDELLDAGFHYTALAVDDIHKQRDLFKGFVYILAEDKSKGSVMDALKKGNFYSSQGPEFTRITFENGILSADFTPVISAIGVMKQYRGICQGIEDAEGPGSEDKEITHFESDLSSFHDNYIRLQLKDRNGRMAWSNPIFLP